jgi:transcriptional regulator with GAF, ATPase, and Fis domain
LPPLRERREDLGLLLARILRATDGKDGPTLSPEAARALLSYGWPLNVRELAQCLSRAIVLADRGVIARSCLPDSVGRALGEPPRPATTPPLDAKAEEDAALRARLVAELTKQGGNVAEVARALGKARTQVHRWMKRFALDADRFRK